MQQVISNSFSTTLSLPLASTDTSLTVVNASNFPTLQANQYALVTVQAGTNFEIIRISAANNSTGVLTVGARAQEGTTAQNFVAGSLVEIRVTAGTLTNALSEYVVATTVDTLPSPTTAVRQAYSCESTVSPAGKPVFAKALSSGLWYFDGYVSTGTDASATTSTTTITTTLAASLPTTPATNAFLVQVTTGSNAGLVRAISSANATTVTLSSALPATAGSFGIEVYWEEANRDDVTKASLSGATFTGGVSAPTPSTADNSTKVCTTAYVQNNLASYAPLSGATFTGTVSVPTGSEVVGVSGAWNSLNFISTSGTRFAAFGTDATNNATVFADNGGAITLWTGGSERARIDSSGNFGLGITTPSSPGGTRNLVVNSTGTTIIKAQTSGTGAVTSRYDWATGTANSYVIAALQDNIGNPYWNLSAGAGVTGAYYDMPIHVFRSGNGSSEYGRFDSNGNLLVGTTTAGLPAQGIALNSGGLASVGIGHTSGTASGTYYSGFAYNGAWIGSITQNGTTAVSYNTTSDARLKTNLGVAKTSRIPDLVVHDFVWKSDGSLARGVFAQEAFEAVPEAVKKGDDGEEVTDAWQVDYSKFVPDLIVEVQALRARVAELEQRPSFWQKLVGFLRF